MRHPAFHTLPEPSFFTLLLMISFGAVNAVLITPALPAIATSFAVSTDTAQLVMTWYLVGYALGQLLYGPLANRFGRKRALYMGVGLQIISSIACIVAGMLDNFTLLIYARFAMALGAGSGLNIAFTIVNEFYEPKAVAQKVSYLVLAFAITPGISTAIGGFLTNHFGWLTSFYAGAIYGILLFPLLMRLPETKPNLDYHALGIKNLLQAYAIQFKNIQLITGGLMMGLTTCFIYVFATFAPFVAIDLLHMNSQTYGIVNIIPSLGYVVGAIVSGHLAKKVSLDANIKIGILVATTGTILMFFGIAMALPAIIAIFITTAVVYFSEALVYPNASAIAMNSAEDKAHASAVMNFLTLILPTLAILSFSIFTITPMILPTIFAVLCIAVTCIYIVSVICRKK